MAGFRGAAVALLVVTFLFAALQPARASLSGEMQGAIADMVNSAIANEDAKGLGAAINDLCAAYPDIKKEIVAAVADQLAARRPPGFCAGRSEPCLDLDGIMDTLLANLPVPYETASGGTRSPGPTGAATRDSTAECGAGDCARESLRSQRADSRTVEPPPSSSPSPTHR